MINVGNLLDTDYDKLSIISPATHKNTITCIGRQGDMVFKGTGRSSFRWSNSILDYFSECSLISPYGLCARRI